MANFPNSFFTSNQFRFDNLFNTTNSFGPFTSLNPLGQFSTSPLGQFSTSSLDEDNIMFEMNLSNRQVSDLNTMSGYAKEIISGYLNLESSQGWEEGGFGNVGAAFSRFILTKYFILRKGQLGKNESIIKKTILSFKYIQKNCFELEGHRPFKSKACYDSGVTGWKDHRITRIVGNLGSVYDSNKPFFEILINSQMVNGNSVCTPFFVSIHENEKDLDERRKLLASFQVVPSEIAESSFYPSYAKKPAEYWQENKHRLGPNSTRTLEALFYLQNVQLPAQTSGNCWIKQPMRSILANLYIEFVTQQRDISYENAWINAKEIYKVIHKSEGIPYVEQLVNSTQMTSQMKESALRAIARQKRI